MSDIVKQTFVKDSFKIRHYFEVLEDKITQNEHLECIQNYHEGITKHRFILETKIKKKILLAKYY